MPISNIISHRNSVGITRITNIYFLLLLLLHYLLDHNVILNNFHAHASTNSNKPPPPPPPPPLPSHTPRNDNNNYDSNQTQNDIYDDIILPRHIDNDEYNEVDDFRISGNRSRRTKNRVFDYYKENEEEEDDDVYLGYQKRQMMNNGRRKQNNYNHNFEDRYDDDVDYRRIKRRRGRKDDSFQNDNWDGNDYDNQDEITRERENLNINIKKQASRDNNNNTQQQKQKRTSFFSSPFKRLGRDKIDIDHRTVIETTHKRKDVLERSNGSMNTKNMVNNEDNQSTNYNPIDYQFPSMDILSKQKKDDENNDDEMSLPETGWKPERDNYNQSLSSKRKNNNFANPRKDAIAQYTSTKMGKMKLALSYTTCGAIFGIFIGKSILGHGKQSAILFAFLFWFMGTFLRDAYGEMVRSVALGLIYLLNRTRSVRRRYRTGAHLKAICHLGGGERVPFPPITSEDGIENMWKYVPQYNDDPEFDMTKSLLCLVIIGSFCGGNIPLIPTWIGSMAGAILFSWMGISKNARGDLMRTMGMRVVALAGEAIDVNAELKIARKVSVVAGKLLDKALILDRKHRIKDKLFAGASWVYDKVSSTVSNVQNDINQEEEEISLRRRRNAEEALEKR